MPRFDPLAAPRLVFRTFVLTFSSGRRVRVPARSFLREAATSCPRDVVRVVGEPHTDVAGGPRSWRVRDAMTVADLVRPCHAAVYPLRWSPLLEVAARPVPMVRVRGALGKDALSLSAVLDHEAAAALTTWFRTCRAQGRIATRRPARPVCIMLGDEDIPEDI